MRTLRIQPTQYQFTGPPKQRHACRCGTLTCQRRITLAKHPDEYQRPPRCPGCRQRGTLRVDRHRMRREWGVRPCKCYGYSFPHAKGRGYCDHNLKLTAEDFREREENNRWA